MVRVLPIGTAVTAASTAQYSCTNFTISVGVSNVTTLATSLNLPNGFAATALANSLTRYDAPTPQFTPGKLTKTFNISAEYCAPKNGTPSTLQLLTHGIGFDRSYWDYRPPGAPMSTNYSYVNAAIEAGYSTFAWDRLGIAPSTLANPYTEVQASVELAILTNLTEMIRSGKISQVPRPSKLLHVGHSYGSQLSNSLVATAPQLSDGVILTGFSHLSEFQGGFIASAAFHIASQNQPRRFPSSRYSNGYLTWADVYAFQYSFLEYPYFSPAVAANVETIKQPFTAGEFMTSPLLPSYARNFTGPVMYLVGSNDLIFCGGNCTGLLNTTSPAVTSYSSSSGVYVYQQPNTGHAINVHYNATGAYQVMTQWAKGHGF